ncbi:hypothetical protein HN51_055224 [Arachis hypogaea]
MPGSLASTLIEEEVVEPQSLEIQEDSDGISLKPFPDSDKHSLELAKNGKTNTKGNIITGDERKWRRVPYLSSYVPFGQVNMLIWLNFLTLILGMMQQKGFGRG